MNQLCIVKSGCRLALIEQVVEPEMPKHFVPLL